MDIFFLIGFVLGEIFNHLTWKGLTMFIIIWIMIYGVWHMLFAY